MSDLRHNSFYKRKKVESAYKFHPSVYSPLPKANISSPNFSMALNLNPQLNPLAAASSSSIHDGSSAVSAAADTTSFPVAASYMPPLSSLRIRSDADALSPPLTPTSRSPSMFSSTRPDLSVACRAFAEVMTDPVVIEHPEGGVAFGGVGGGGFGGVPVYVMMPLDSVRMDGKGVNRKKAMAASMRALRSAGVEGIMVDVWWGLVEKEEGGKYEWGGYEELFDMASKNGLKVQAVMSFHQCGGNVGDSCL